MAPTRMLALAAGILLAAACGPKGTDEQPDAARATNEEGVSLALCGVVARYVAPTPERNGLLGIERVSWTVAAGALIRGAELLARGTEICVVAGIDADGRITDCAVTPKSPDPWDAGARPE